MQARAKITILFNLSEFKTDLETIRAVIYKQNEVYDFEIIDDEIYLCYKKEQIENPSILDRDDKQKIPMNRFLKWFEPSDKKEYLSRLYRRKLDNYIFGEELK